MQGSLATRRNGQNDEHWMRSRGLRRVASLVLCALAMEAASWAATDYAAGRPVTASSVYQTYYASNAVDKTVSDASRWLGNASASGNWLIVDLGTAVTLRQAHIYSGYQTQDGSAVTNVLLQSWNGSSWQNISGAQTTANNSFAFALNFSSPVTTSKVRLVISDTSVCRVRELALWDVPTDLYTGMVGNLVPLDSGVPIRVNQIGYQFGAPKRFTAPTSPDGTAYAITWPTNTSPLFSGLITNGLADFSSFEPTNPGPYVIRVSLPGQTPGVSDPFLVESNLISDKLLPPAVEFMVDCRSGVGTHPSAFGGCPWRDGTYYSFEVPSLIYLFLNDRDAMLSLPRDVNYAADKAKVLAPNYATGVFVTTTEDSGFVSALQQYYTNYAPVLRTNTPDALQCVHFGLGVTLGRPATMDWTDNSLPRQINSQTVEWCAYFLYAWPVLRDWFADSYYKSVHDFAFAQWPVRSPGNPSPLDIDPLWDPSSYGTNNAPYKGRHAPGHSILPNLLMWQVAVREGRSDAPQYLSAAQAQAQWCMDHLDWNDPLTTKGHRMSEHKTLPGLAWFQTHFPNQAPAGLKAKIQSWADVMISRSTNMWDYRCWDNGTNWSMPALSANWNEPGNIAGLPACALAAASAIDSPVQKQRLREISWAAMDCLFGRNPLRAASPSLPAMGFPDVERGWPTGFTGPAAYLETVRGVLNSSPGSEVFPFNPNGALRYAEGWTHFNAAWNVGLAYLLADSKGADPLPVHLPLVISEIFPATNSAEYVELYNPTTQPVRLSGLTLGGAISFDFNTGTLTDLAPKARCLVVRNASAFQAAYGTNRPVIGTYFGSLPLKGAVISIGDTNGNTFSSVDYSGTNLFAGYSVVFTGDETTFPAGPWRPSAFPGGSPGEMDSVTMSAEPSGNPKPKGVNTLLWHATTGLDHPYVAPQITHVTVNTNGAPAQFPALSQSRNLRADDVSMSVTWSSNLTGWAAATLVDSQTILNGDGTETLFWRAGMPSAQLPLAFFRLQTQLVNPVQ